MNEHEVRALINKIIQADRVIHMQQLGIAWEPPTDPIFGFSEKSGQSQTGAGNNTSIMDSSKHGMSKSEFEGDQSVVTGTQGGANTSNIQQAYDYKVSIAKIKNVFKLLINECPFLIDDKAYAESEGKPVKEQFTIQIDSIRKSLGIDNMDDVELLVLTFYDFADRQRMDALNGGSSHHDGTTGEQHSDDHASNAGKKKGAQPAAAAHHHSEERKNTVEEYVPLGDDDALIIDNDDIVGILKDFHRKREERANNAELVGNPRMKKRSNFETEE